MSLLIQNAHTLRGLLREDDNQPDEMTTVDVLIEGDRIVELGPKLSPGTHRRIDAQGLTLLPGLFDPQVHFREPGQEHKETLHTGALAAARGGFTGVVCMPNTSPTADNPETIRWIVDKAQAEACIRIYPTGTVTKGLQSRELTDFGALKQAGIIALTDDGRGVQDDNIMRRAFEHAGKLGLSILDHAEDESLSAGGAVHAGERSRSKGVKGIDPAAEVVHVERGCRLAQETGTHYHVLHISTAGAMAAVIKAKQAGAPVTAEVAPHHLLLCDEDIPDRGEDLDPLFKMNPPLRGRHDRDAIEKAFLEGWIDAVATDHAPHTQEEKQQGIHEAPFGIVGLETAFPLLYTAYVKTGRMSFTKLVNMMSAEAAQLFGLNWPRLALGQVADVVLVDLHTAHCVTPEEFLSQGRNTPFAGRQLHGWPVLTLCAGEVVYRAADLVSKG